jgi:hypothetical protein
VDEPVPVEDGDVAVVQTASAAEVGQEFLKMERLRPRYSPEPASGPAQIGPSS